MKMFLEKACWSLIALLSVMFLDAVHGRWERVFYCDFETEYICGFSQDTADVLDWHRASGRTHSRGTGPRDDHTPNGEYYMYFEASNISPELEARLMSPWFEVETKEVFVISFYYHMYGRGMGHLNTYVDDRTDGRKSRERFLWSELGNQGGEWHRADLVLDIEQDFRIVFEGIRGVNSRSDMAIDDVHVFRTDSPLQCNFESYCSLFKQEFRDGVLNWTSNSAATPTYMTGPMYDNTYKNETGHYMYLEATSQNQGQTARLVSSHFVTMEDERFDRFFSFNYHMYGSGIGALNVYLATMESEELVWSRAGNQGDSWHYAEIAVYNNQTYQIILEGVIGDYRHGDIAIDDLGISTYNTADTLNSTIVITPHIPLGKPEPTKEHVEKEQAAQTVKPLAAVQRTSSTVSRALTFGCVFGAVAIISIALIMAYMLYRWKRINVGRGGDDQRTIVEAEYNNKIDENVSVNVFDATAFHNMFGKNSSATAASKMDDGGEKTTREERGVNSGGTKEQNVVTLENHSKA
ncbi:MAM and LDL-receptor class A domain-containing protein 1-like isoform X2 [Ptychodera flava]|uniref:MAM and LDL-receptor class A domain-containing protein 1-like isoform X2 n=1 Tax=Ptychodera flava TaxID=63121 RepID=UPI003969C018